MGDRKDRDERLAAALRENLKRRKAQQRGRAAEPAGEDPEDAPPGLPPNGDDAASG
jgi:hypothetical protein